jgi:hypothetical protein
MKLLEFVDYLLDPAKLADFYHQQGFGPEVVEHRLTIYMVGSTIMLDADIRLLTFEETEGFIEVQLNGVDYVYVLEVDLAIDLLMASEPGVVTKLDQANRIVEYAIYDALARPRVSKPSKTRYWPLFTGGAWPVSP